MPEPTRRINKTKPKILTVSLSFVTMTYSSKHKKYIFHKQAGSRFCYTTIFLAGVMGIPHLTKSSSVQVLRIVKDLYTEEFG